MSASQTRGQHQALYDRLLKRVNTVKLPEGMPRTIVDVARTILELHPPSATSSSASTSTPEEIEALMKSLLPSPSEVFSESFFRAPLFAIVSLRDVANFYGCGSVDEDIINALAFDESQVGNKNIMVHVWFASILECDINTIIAGVAWYKRTRGSPNMLLNPDLPPSVRATSAQEDAPSPSNNVEIVRDAVGNLHVTTPVVPHVNVEPTPVDGTPFPVADFNATRNGDSNAVEDAQLVDPNASRKATNVFQYFKDSKFNGDIRQSIDLTLRDYMICARQHNLSPRQKADFFVNALADPARTFFFNNAHDKMTFDDMAKMMVKEYNSDARQLQVQGILETLRLDKLMTEQGLTSFSTGLTKAIDLIERLTPQCQPQFRSDANKINFLRKAVLGYTWALTPIGNIITAKYTFNSFVTALREHLQLANEVNTTATPKEPLPPPPDGTFYQQYGRHPKHVRKHVPQAHHQRHPPPRNANQDSFAESRRKGICHRCKQRWVPGHRCRPGSIRNQVRHRFKNGDSAVHIVSDLVLGLEGEASAQEEADVDSDAHGDDEVQQDVHYGDAAELSVFDELTADEDAQDTGHVEEVAQEWFTNHLSASFTMQEPPPSPAPQDF